jgi:hypothetical protein
MLMDTPWFVSLGIAVAAAKLAIATKLGNDARGMQCEFRIFDTERL